MSSATQTITTPWRFPGCPGPPDWRVDLDPLVDRFDWLRRMGDCPQDPVWHAEGDVLTHVRMVCEALAALRAWRELPEAERHVVFAATLLHDVAKPLFTKEEDGHIRSRGHARGGARVARRILMEGADGAPGFDPPAFGVREQIVGLVRHHGLPAVFLDKPDPQRAVIAAAVTARCDLLSVLAEADARGRICRGPDDAAERVGLFREFCAEVGCPAGPYPFASDHSRFRYFQSDALPPTLQVYDDTRLEVTVMSGLPAAGKDTWVAAHAGERPVISLDVLRGELDVDPRDDQGEVIVAAKELAKDYLRARQPFIWNATNTSRTLRDGLVRLFAAYRARVRIVYCEAPPAMTRERNARRRAPVPEAVMEKLFNGLDVPDLTEAHEVVYVGSLPVG